MPGKNNAIQLLILIGIVLTLLVLALVYFLDIGKSAGTDEEQALQGDLPRTTQTEPEIVTDIPGGQQEEELLAAGAEPGIEDAESLDERSPARQQLETKGEATFFIHGRVVNEDGAALPEDLRIACIDDMPPFSEISALSGMKTRDLVMWPMYTPDTELDEDGKSDSKGIPYLAAAGVDPGGAFVLRGLPSKSFYLAPLDPFLRVARVDKVNTRVFKDFLAAESEPFYTLELAGAGVVEGVLLTPDEEPAPGATVTLGGEFNALSMFSNKKTRIQAVSMETDEKGRFRFEQAPPGHRLALNAECAGYGPAGKKMISLRADQVLSMDLSLRAPCAIGGMVKRPDGTPAAEIKVQLLKTKASFTDPESGKVEELRTGEDGTFLFADLAPNAYTVQLFERGFLPERVEGITLDVGEKKMDVIFVLSTGLDIKGAVTDGDGKPIEGAWINATMSYSLLNITETIRQAGFNISARSDVLGHFSLTGLRDSNYDVTVVAEDYSMVKKTGIAAGTSDLAITLTSGGLVSGIVISATSGEPVKNYTIQQNQVKGAETSMMDPFGFANRRSHSIHDEKGKFTIRSMASGSYDLTFTAAGFGTQILESVVLDPGATVRGLIVAMAPESSLSGFVFDGKTGGSVEGATLSQKSGMEGLIESFIGGGSTSTDQDGFFRLGGLAEGKHRLTIRHGDYIETSTEVFQLAEGEAIEDIEIALEQGSCIHGHVLDENDDPIAGATIMVSNSTGTSLKSATTDADGYYEVLGMAKGAYVVTKMPGALDLGGDNFIGAMMEGIETRNVKVEADTDLVCDFIGGEALGEGARVTGVVRQNDKPTSNAIVQLHRSGKLVESDKPKTTTTNQQGIYNFEGVVPGSYSLLVTGASDFDVGAYTMNSYELDVPEDEDLVEKDIELPGGSITGTVRDTKTLNPLKGVRVVLYDEDEAPTSEFLAEALGNKMAETYTDGAGRFAISTLKDGDYLIRAGGMNLLGMDSGGYAVRYIGGIKIGAARETHDLSIDLVKGGILEGYVFDTAGQPINGVSVHLRAPGEAEFEFFSEIKTDQSGFFRYLGIPPGTNALEFRCTGYASKAAEDLWVQSEEATAVSVKLGNE